MDPPERVNQWNFHYGAGALAPPASRIPIAIFAAFEITVSRVIILFSHRIEMGSA